MAEIKVLNTEINKFFMEIIFCILVRSLLFHFQYYNHFAVGSGNQSCLSLIECFWFAHPQKFACLDSLFLFHVETGLSRPVHVRAECLGEHFFNLSSRPSKGPVIGVRCEDYF